MTLPEPVVSYLDRLAEINHTNRSRTVEILTDMIQEYFTEEQLKLEFQYRAGTDNRTKKSQG